MSSRSSRPSLTSLHDAARKGDSRSLQRLITIIDPTAAKKVAAVFLQRDSGKATCTSSAGTDPSLGKKVQGHTYNKRHRSSEELLYSGRDSCVELFQFQQLVYRVLHIGSFQACSRDL